MDHDEAARHWEDNAEVWTQLSRAGFDVYRDSFNTPGFLAMLPDVARLRGLDIGCGEGHNTRLVARRAGGMTGVDVSRTFVRHAREAEAREPLGISYRVGNALALPFGGGRFDFATAVMCLMDVPDPGQALREACRVLKPGGFLQFSICHPCFTTPHRRQVRDEAGRTLAIEVGDYFRELNGEMSEWIFSAAPHEVVAGLPRFKVPQFTRTISQWLNLTIDAGFAIERVGEPRPDDEAVREWPNVQDAQVVAYFLHIRARKPGV